MRERVYFSLLTSYAVHHWGKSGQDLKAQTEGKCCMPASSQFAFSYSLKLPTWGMAPPTVGVTLLHQLIQITPTDMFAGQPDLGNYLVKVFFSDDLS